VYGPTQLCWCFMGLILLFCCLQKLLLQPWQPMSTVCVLIMVGMLEGDGNWRVRSCAYSGTCGLNCCALF
jgi:hypothetical protein